MTLYLLGIRFGGGLPHGQWTGLSQQMISPEKQSFHSVRLQVPDWVIAETGWKKWQVQETGWKENGSLLVNLPTRLHSGQPMSSTKTRPCLKNQDNCAISTES